MIKKKQLLTHGSWENGAQWKFYFGTDLPDLPAVAVCGLYIKNDCILLTHNERGWDMTGGHIEKGETLLEALFREVLEEGGVHVSDHRLFGYNIVTYKKNTLNKTTGFSYPISSLIPHFLVTTNQSVENPSARECTEAKLFHVNSPEVQNFRVKGLLTGIYLHAKERNLLFD